jgi:hypothetical protein
MAGFVKLKGPDDENAVDTITIDGVTYMRRTTRPDPSFTTGEEAMQLQSQILEELKKMNVQLALITGECNGTSD